MTGVLPFQRVLMTGGSGFVGRHFVQALASRLGPAARLVLGVHRSGVPAGFDTVHLDLVDPVGTAVAIEATQPDLIVHLSAQSTVIGPDADSASWVVNVGGTLALAKAAAKATSRPTFFFVSSQEVYGEALSEGSPTESALLRPTSAYGRSKAAAEAMLSDVLPRDARLIVARPSNHSGAGQDERFVIPALASQIARVERGSARTISVGDLDARRDFLDVHDVVQAYMHLISISHDLPLRTIFNVSSGRQTGIREVVERLAAISTAKDIRCEVEQSRIRGQDATRWPMDATALRSTGWAPQRHLDQTLRDVLMYQRQRIAEHESER